MGWATKLTSVSKHSNGTPGKKPPAPSLKVRRGRTPLEQRLNSKPLEQSAQRRRPKRPKLVGVANRTRCDAGGGRLAGVVAAIHRAVSPRAADTQARAEQLLRTTRKRRLPSVGFAGKWHGNSAFLASAHCSSIEDKEFRAFAKSSN
jgi:hypothetical protein